MESLFRQAGFTPAEQSTTPVVIGKVLLDQLVFSPPFNLLYFYVLGALQVSGHHTHATSPVELSMGARGIG
jgi:hypothetical protein